MRMNEDYTSLSQETNVLIRYSTLVSYRQYKLRFDLYFLVFVWVFAIRFKHPRRIVALNLCEP